MPNQKKSIFIDFDAFIYILYIPVKWRPIKFEFKNLIILIYMFTRAAVIRSKDLYISKTDNLLTSCLWGNSIWKHLNI